MRVFVTGATGFIGSAVVAELQKRDHSVVGLARSDAAARRLSEMGASAHRGDLSDLESLAAGARAAEGVIHLAFGIDFSRYLELAEHDRRVVAAMASELDGSDRGLVATSVTTLLADGVLGTELDDPEPGNPIGARAATEDAVSQRLAVVYAPAPFACRPRCMARATAASSQPSSAVRSAPVYRPPERGIPMSQETEVREHRQRWKSAFQEAVSNDAARKPAVKMLSSCLSFNRHITTPT